MESTITTAAQEYARRPKDERFPSLDALVDFSIAEKNASAERVYNLKDLRAEATGPREGHTAPAGSQATIQLASPNGRARFTHYSFGQLARTIGAPAGYLRTLPPQIAADAINFGLQSSDTGTTANLLARAPKAAGELPTIRACTSESYGRVWDQEFYGSLRDRFQGQGRGVAGRSWITPPTWTGEPAGVYRGDRDSFVILVDGGSIVSDPSLRQSTSGGTMLGGTVPGVPGQPADGMYRGIMVRNSEVGHCSITIETILFRYICGNHMLWGAMVDKTFRRRHVGNKITRDTLSELNTIAWKWTQRSAAEDEQLIRGLIKQEIASTKEAVIDELKKMGATKQQATDAYEACERTEAASPRSFWGIAQGITRNSQESGYQDDRLTLDMLAAQVLKKGRALVAV